jgi:SAM-dependent methyltransferase
MQVVTKGQGAQCRRRLPGRFSLVDGELISQDITWPGDERNNIQIYSPLHKIPFESNYFDAILCIAVLEHVENPEEVVPELYRVLKPGGHSILEVPFLQPEHKVPTDFQVAQMRDVALVLSLVLELLAGAIIFLNR